MTGGEFAFVDRIEEMDRIQNFLKEAKEGSGNLILLRGEAGSGKTRLLEEAATRAEEKGLTVAIGTALPESVAPYHLWEEVLEELGLSRILEEPTPPKLIGLYFISPEGNILSKVERDDDGIDSDVLSKMVVRLAKSLRDSKAQDLTGNLTVLNEDGHRVLLGRASSFCLGAVLEGDENETFIADMMALADRFESQCKEGSVSRVGKESQSHFEEPMRQLLESLKYEGVQYTVDDPKIRQSRLFEHIGVGLSRKSGIHPLCVVLDDLQWADPTSLSLLKYIARNTRDSRILILGAYRVEEVDARPHLRNALSELEREELLDETDLIGLYREYLSDLTGSFLGPHALSEEFLDLLWQETRGNPLFVREVLFRLEEDGVLAVEGIAKRITVPLESISIADRVREVVRERLENLPEDDRKLLEAAATCGSRFTTTLLAKVTRTEEGKVLNGLRNMSRVHGLLRPKGSGYVFDHPAVQEVVYENIPEQDKHAYHREAAEWLELAGGPIEEIGEHYYRAGDPRAGGKLKQAGEEAADKYANQEAIRFFTAALEFEEDAERKVGIHVSIGEVYDLTGDYEKSEEAYKRAVERTQKKRMKADIMAKIGRIKWESGRYDESLSILAEALDLVRGVGCGEEANALNQIGVVHWDRGEYDKALEFYNNSLEIRENIGDQTGIASTLHNIGNLHSRRGELDLAQQCYEESLEIRRKIGDRIGIAGSLNSIGFVHSGRGEYDKALEFYNNSLEIHENIGDLKGITTALRNIGVLHLDREEYDKALEFFEKDQGISEKIGDESGVAHVLNNIGFVHYGRGEYDKALEMFSKSLDLKRKIGDQRGIANTLGNMELVHESKGDWLKAMDLAIQADEISTAIGAMDYVAQENRALGSIHGKLGEWRESIYHFEKSIRVCEKAGFGTECAKSYYEFGLMWKAKGEPEKAKELLMKALGSFEKVGMEDKADEVRGAIAEIESE